MVMQQSADWNKNLSEINLHNKVVGDSCIAWGADNTIIIGTSKNVISCDMSLLINSEKKPKEVEFMIDNVLVNEKEYYLDQEIDGFLQKFDSACMKSSNTAAAPSYNVYKIFLDPSLYKVKGLGFKGCKTVAFSPPGCCKEDNGQLLAVLSIDHSLQICQKVPDAISAKWKSKYDLSRILQHHLHLNQGCFEGFLYDKSMVALEVAQEKSFSTSIVCLAWSDIMKLNTSLACFLATCTRNGFVVIWKINLPVSQETKVEMACVFKCDWQCITSLCFRKMKSTSSNIPSKCSSLGLALSKRDGQIVCYSLQCKEGKLKTSDHKLIWNEADLLAARQMHWLDMQEGDSLLIASKSHVIVGLRLSADLNVLEEFCLQDAHILPIVKLKMVEENEMLQMFSCSSDGVIVKVNIAMSPSLLLQLSGDVSTASETGSFNANYPAILHGTAFSPNGAFMALLKSRPKVRLTIQVENIANLSLKRMLNPLQASEKLLHIASSNDNISLNSCLDLLELVRQHYILTRKFENPIAEFLTLPLDRTRNNIRLLQLRWHLTRLKDATTQTGQLMNVASCVTATTPASCNDLKAIEEVLIIKQMIKILKALHRSLSSVQSTAGLDIPVVQLVNFLKSKSAILNKQEKKALEEIQGSPFYVTLPLHLICAITSLPYQLSDDGKQGITSDESRWPMCCLTFTILQEPCKRRCRLSGSYAAFPKSSQPDWLNDLLQTNCIFSDVPLT